MNKGETVSVVVPIYNSEDTIAACVESIARQTHSEIEIVLVDDGSSDASGRICDHMASRDPRMAVIHQPNRGRTEARRVGVEHSHGEWVTFVDSDDTLPPDSVSSLLRAATGTDIVLGNGHTLAGEHRASIPIDEFRHMAVRGEGTIGVPWGSLYRRSVLTEELFDLPRNIMMGEDYIFWLRLVFSVGRPVNVVYDSVYNKGAEHTSNSFVWTSAYAQRIHDYRVQAIPPGQAGQFEADMLADRVANLFAVATCSPQSEWRHGAFHADIVRDAARLGAPLTVGQRLFLWLPSLRLRRAGSRLVSFLSAAMAGSERANVYPDKD